MTANTINVAVVGLDGHGPVFIDALNGARPVVEGLRVVKAMAHPSVMISAQQLAQNVERTRSLGVAIVDAPEELAEGVDGILILHDDGARHQDLVRMCAGLGKPLFVDKPLAADAAAAREIAAICARHRCPFFSASSLRFSVELRAALCDPAGGPVRSAMTFSPYAPSPSMPGWIYYAVHAVEPLYTIMGPGCRELACRDSPFGPVAIGRWADGRIGIAKGNTGCPHEYGFTLWREHASVATKVNAEGLYPELLREIRRFLLTREAPVSARESVEVIAFLEAANRSMANGGALVSF